MTTALPGAGRCPCCNSPLLDWGRKGEWRIARCRGCSYGLIWPRPDSAFLLDFYKKHGLSGERGVLADRYRRYLTGEEEPALVWRDLNAFGIRGGRLLDVGAGYGRFAGYFRDRGFHVTALEPDPVSASSAEGRLDSPVVQEAFENWVPAGDARLFDVVVMSQVLEHVLCPSAWMRKAASMLTPRGVVVVSTPNFSSLLVWILREGEGHICPPEHINFFTATALRRLGHSCGLALASLRCHSMLPLGLAIASMQDRLHRTWAPAGAVLGTSLWAALRVSDHLRLGRYLYAYHKVATA